MKNRGAFIVFFAALLLCVLFVVTICAQTTSSDTTEKEIQRAVTGCMACSTGLIVIALIAFVVNIILLVWVARDAKNRGMGSAVGWMLFVFFFGIIALIIYIFSRPKGQIDKCPRCQNSKLTAMTNCPHCGVSTIGEGSKATEPPKPS